MNGITFGAYSTVVRFMKGMFQSRPTVPNTQKDEKVLSHLKTIPNRNGATLKDLVSAQRGQTIHMPNLEGTISNDSQITFVMSKPIEQTKPGVKSAHIKFTSYSVDPPFFWSLH